MVERVPRESYALALNDLYYKQVPLIVYYFFFVSLLRIEYFIKPLIHLRQDSHRNIRTLGPTAWGQPESPFSAQVQCVGLGQC